MKKLLAVLMAAVLLLGMTAVAEGEPVEIAFDESDAAFEGSWVRFEDGFQVYLPNDWVISDGSEDMAMDVYAYAASEDGAYVLVFLYSEVEFAENAALIANLEAQGATGVMEFTLNGIPAVGYDIEASNLAAIAILDGDGGMYTFACTPADDEAFLPMASTMLFSISPIA